MTMQVRAISSVFLLALLLAVPAPGQTADAQQIQITIPANTVVHVTLDQPLNSATTQIGQQVTATVSPMDLSGFPTGTRFQGIVTEVARADSDSPGVINVRWYAVTLPNPQLVSVDGRLYSLSPTHTYRNPYGRLYARGYYPDRYDYYYDDYRRYRIEDDDDFDPRWIGYGAAGGAVLGAVTGLGFLEGAALGGLGGAVYSWIRSGGGLPFIGYAPPGDLTVQPASFTPGNQPGQAGQQAVLYREVTVTAGEPFGIRLMQPVSFDSKQSFRFPSRDEVTRDEKLIVRPERYQTATVVVSGRPVDFKEHRPMSVNGALYIPLQPVAQAANMQIAWSPWSNAFVLQTPSGQAQGVIGHRFVVFRDQQGQMRRVGMIGEPVTINGAIYVPVSFISRVTGWQGRWEPAESRLVLEPRVQAARR
jgi:hypothetical protein